MQLNPTKVEYFGITDDCTECQCCGRKNLKKTVMLLVLDADGNAQELTYFGTGCAARALGTTSRYVTRAAAAAEENRQHRIRVLKANLTLDPGGRYPTQARKLWAQTAAAGHTINVNGVEYGRNCGQGFLFKDFAIAQTAAWQNELASLTR